MKTFKEFIGEAKKSRVVGTFKKVPTAKVIVKQAQFAGMPRLSVYVDMGQGMGTQRIKTGLDVKMTDKEIANVLKNGAWAKQFNKAGGVNWVK